MMLLSFFAARRDALERPRVLRFKRLFALISAMRFALSAAISFCLSPWLRSTLPNMLGSSVMVSGGSFSRSATTSDSRRCSLVSYGLASKASKLGSPAPGTNIDVYPLECPMPSTSSKGTKRMHSASRPGSRCVMYGTDARETSPSRKTCTMAPHEAASNPRSDISMEVTGLGVMYECSGRYVRTSQTFSVPSRPAVARYLPPRSMTRSHTGPLWQSILATGSPRFGVQSVTVPFE
mmetsp:Transcript_8702/g.26762  ORF Transcript_8702/g.26762 Transcript_8702/m.26762 type:complete len:236 (-) Transcript_8702:951-1658(-)